MLVKALSDVTHWSGGGKSIIKCGHSYRITYISDFLYEVKCDDGEYRILNSNYFSKVSIWRINKISNLIKLLDYIR